jgi:hypothetical protein
VDNVIDTQRIGERYVTDGQPIETAAIPASPGDVRIPAHTALHTDNPQDLLIIRQ